MTRIRVAAIQAKSIMTNTQGVIFPFVTKKLESGYKDGRISQYTQPNVHRMPQHDNSTAGERRSTNYNLYSKVRAQP
jgi:hypothetical protein